MKTRENGNASGPQAVAALWASGGRWRLVIASARDRVEIEHAGELEVGAKDAVADAMRRHGATRLIRVAPSASTVCRVVMLPAGLSAAEARSALEMRAEVDLPGNAPGYRRAAAVLAGDAGISPALLTAWTGDEESAVRAGETWTTEIAALAALCRGSATAVLVDRSAGTISIFVRSRPGIAARVLREDNSSAQVWGEAVDASIAEAGELAGLEPRAAFDSIEGLDSLEEGSGLLLSGALSGELRGRVGFPSNPSAAWFSAFGVPLGAVLAWADADLEPLTRMTGKPTAREESLVAAGVRWLSSPMRAWGLAAACVLAVLVLPLVAAYGRTAILEGRRERVEENEPRMRTIAGTAALYEQLAESRLPMTKLLASISQSTPVDVVIESVEIGSDRDIAIAGRAGSRELLNDFTAKLMEAGVFESVRTPRSDTSAEGVGFELTARVANPHSPLSKTEEDDFGSQPLAVRLYGEGASNTYWKGEAASSGGSSSRGARATTRPRPGRDASDESGESSGAERPTERPTREAGSDPDQPPSALSDEAIAAMDKSTAMREWANRKKVADKFDAEIKARLEEEIQKLQTHFQGL